MTRGGGRAFAALHGAAMVVPVTTRITEQYRRVTLPGPPPRVRGRRQRRVAARRRRRRPRLDGARSRARLAGGRRRSTRCGTTSAGCAGPECTDQAAQRRATCSATRSCTGAAAGRLRRRASTAWAAERGWRTSLQGRKLYWVPEPLTKSAAVAEVADARRRRCGARRRRLAARRRPARGRRPRHLARARRTRRRAAGRAPHVTVTDAGGRRGRRGDRGLVLGAQRRLTKPASARAAAAQTATQDEQGEHTRTYGGQHPRAGRSTAELDDLRGVDRHAGGRAGRLAPRAAADTAALSGSPCGGVRSADATVGASAGGADPLGVSTSALMLSVLISESTSASSSGARTLESAASASTTGASAGVSSGASAGVSAGGSAASSRGGGASAEDAAAALPAHASVLSATGSAPAVAGLVR